MLKRHDKLKKMWKTWLS